MKTRYSRKLYLSVAGTMGIGKSTITRFIAQEFGFTPVFENFKDNPFLAQFYKHMNKWAFHSQAFFLAEKAEQIEKIKTIIKKTPVVQDTPIYQDVYSYGKAQVLLKNMTKDEWSLYLKLFSLMENNLVKPDIIFFLTASVETIYDRIQHRNRAFEPVGGKKEFVRYLTMLDKLNNQWIKRAAKWCKVIEIPTEGINYVTDHKAKARLKEKIRLLVSG